MELKKAAAILNKNVVTRRSQLQQFENKGICISCPLDVAETLLAALDRPEGTPMYQRPYIDALARPPAVRPPPTILVGREVHGWGWKVFREHGGELHSELVGKAYYKPAFLPENQWLFYRDWQDYERRVSEAFHVLKTHGAAVEWTNRSGAHGRLTIRKVAWRELKNLEPHVWPPDFEDKIFTAEEIYILPEEGMPVEPAERPPEKGDWVYSEGWARPLKVRERRFGNTSVRLWDGTPYKDEDLRIVRRAGGPLRVKDKVAFGSKEGWVTDDGGGEEKVRLNFSANRHPEVHEDNYGWFATKDLTLVEPYYEPKGDC